MPKRLRYVTDIAGIEVGRAGGGSIEKYRHAALPWM